MGTGMRMDGMVGEAGRGAGVGLRVCGWCGLWTSISLLSAPFSAPSKAMSTPRVFIIRHGETEWSLNGRHTGTTELPLTANGESRIRATGKALVGDDRLIVPKQLTHVYVSAPFTSPQPLPHLLSEITANPSPAASSYVSPRKRAQRTVELLNLGCEGRLPWDHEAEAPPALKPRTDAKVQVTEDIREWDYGDYEGKTSKQIREERKEQGMGEWDIWRDGCPGGE